MSSENPSSPSSLPSVPGAEKRICPRCGQETKKISIEQTEHDALGIAFAGIWAAKYPNKNTALVCEHCSHVFGQRVLHDPAASKLIGRLILFFSLLMVLAVIVLLVWGKVLHHSPRP